MLILILQIKLGCIFVTPGILINFYIQTDPPYQLELYNMVITPLQSGWQSVMFEDCILVVELSSSWPESQRSHVIQHSPLALTGLDKQSERSDLINWLVMSVYLAYSLSIWLSWLYSSNLLLLWQTTNPFYLKGSSWRSVELTYLKPFNCVQTN